MPSLIPEALKGLPDILQKVLGPPITVSGLAAILLTLILPEESPTASPAGKPDEVWELTITASSNVEGPV